MPETTATDRERAVFKVFIKGPIEAVWREITKTDSVQRAMFNMCLVTPGMKPGSPFQMRSKDGKVVGIVGEILEYDPPHRYVTTFKFTRMDDPPCKITYELKSVAGGTEFVMSYDDLPAGTTTAKQMLQGGTLIVNTLKSLVETGKLPFGTKMLYAMLSVFGLFVPKKCRVENWPMKKS